MGPVILRLGFIGVEIIPKPGFSRRTKKTESYHKQQNELAEMYQMTAIVEKVQVPLTDITISFVANYADRRQRDWDNIAKAIQDALIKAGIVEDDNATIIKGADRCRVRLGSKNPGHWVELRENDEH
jgi:Holliday junction resolvase RusA-like endonuclease